MLATWVPLVCGMPPTVGDVSSKNVTETVTTIAVPLVADLARAWFVDSEELFLSHLALMNLKTIAKLLISIIVNGPNEYRT